MADTAPKGVLPKNLQTWALLGITLLVVAVIALSGTSNKANTNKKTSSGGGSTKAGNQEPAEELDQYAQRLAQLKADTERAQQDALVAQQQMLNQMATQSPPLDPAMMPAPSPGPDEELERMRTKREYTSLFSSQIARSYREGAPSVGRQDPPNSDPSEGDPLAEARRPAGNDARIQGLTQRLRDLDEQQRQLMGAFQAPPVTGVPQTAATGTAPASRPDTTARNQTAPDAQNYALLEGTVLEAALVTRINSDFAGPVIAQITSPIYSRNRQRVLIPAGSRVIGEAKRTEAFGQTRLAVVFHRLLMPDGYSVDLDQFTGISSRGESALADQVNHHYLRIFGTSIALGVLGGVSSIGTNGTNPSTWDTFRMGGSAQFGQSATRILEHFLNILPTITIREGHRMRIWIAQDLSLPAYQAHQMPRDM